MRYFVVLDTANIVSYTGNLPPGAEADAIKVLNAIEVTENQYSQIARDQSRRWRFADSTLTDVTPEIPVGTLQTQAIARVNELAEQARLQWITPGSGQAMEYQQSATEATLANAAPDPLDSTQYPMLNAELLANQTAGNTTVTLRQIAQNALAQKAAWETAGATIKQTRYAAKFKIMQATTQEEINAVLSALSWPTPPPP